MCSCIDIYLPTYLNQEQLRLAWQASSQESPKSPKLAPPLEALLSLGLSLMQTLETGLSGDLRTPRSSRVVLASPVLKALGSRASLFETNTSGTVKIRRSRKKHAARSEASGHPRRPSSAPRIASFQAQALSRTRKKEQMGSTVMRWGHCDLNVF